MKHPAWMCALVVVATLCAASAQDRTAREADRVELNRLEEVWNQAHLHGDAEALERLWADDLEVAVPEMPVFKKAELVEFVRSGRMRFQRYETSDINIRVYESSAVVTGRLRRSRVMGTREAADDWRFTKIYVRNGGHWRVVSFHASQAAKAN